MCCNENVFITEFQRSLELKGSNIFVISYICILKVQIRQKLIE